MSRDSAVSPLSLGQARLLQLAAQGLLQPPRRRARRADVVAAIGRMGVLQIDTIHVVARSPYLVLHARLGDYPMAWLDEALAEGKLAETWVHEACFVSAADLPWHRAWLARRDNHWAHQHATRMHREQRDGMDDLLARIRADGPVRAADFARGQDAASSGWWEWKPEKRWLEAWFALGELMVLRRERFQRVYELSERVLARLDPPPDPRVAAYPADELRRRFILDSVRALGVVPAAWIADYHRLKPRVAAAELAPLLASGELLAVTVQGWAAPGYVHRGHAGLLERALRGRLRATHTALLSPFDPLVWDRTRLRAMFDFDYSLECYTPAARRRYGYFVLPILHRGRLVGRLDAKAHRSEGLFEVKSIELELGVEIEARLLAALAQTILDAARWHGTPQVRVVRSRPAGFARLLRTELHRLA